MEKKVITLLKENVEELRYIDVSSTTQLITTGFMESFDVIQLLAVLEEAFGVELPLDNLNLEDFNTAASITRIIKRAQEDMK